VGGAVNDSYLEFVIGDTNNEFIDLSSLALEMKINVTNADGTALTNANHVTLVDGWGHRILQSHSVYLNGVQTEGNSISGMLNTVKIYTQHESVHADGFLRNMGYKDRSETIRDTVDDNYFTAANMHSNESRIVTNLKNRGLVHAMTLLNTDLSTSGSYLCDLVEYRIRIDLAPASVIIHSHDAGADYRYHIHLSKLWVRKVRPTPSALLALNRELISKNLSLEYLFERPLVKTLIYPSNHTSITIDSPFHGIIPHRLMLFIVDQDSVNGSYARNAAFFTHCNLTNLKLEINGNAMSNISCNFPDSIAQAYYQTLSASGVNKGKSLLTFDHFRSGRSIFCWECRAGDSDDTLSVEEQGSLRITLTSSIANTANKVIYIVGFTTGLVEINGDRRIFPHFLQ
jgi:hypothetical protein